MTAPFAKPSEAPSATNFFRPKDLAVALAVLFEPKQVLDDQPRTFNKAVTGYGTDVIADLTVFENQAQLDGAASPVTLKAIRVDKTGIVNVIKHSVGGAVLGRVAKLQGKEAAYWGIEDADDATTAKVAAYFEKRQAAVAAAPSFDD